MSRVSIWRLRERLAVAVLALPLALGGCEKKSRQEPVPTSGLAADAAPAPEPKVVDATVATDGGAELKPRTGGCWKQRQCVPVKQARRAAVGAATALDCPSLVSKRKAELLRANDDPVSIDQRQTEQARAAGSADVCCYGWEVCGRGRPARERGIARRARPRRGGAWS